MDDQDGGLVFPESLLMCSGVAPGGVLLGVVVELLTSSELSCWL